MVSWADGQGLSPLLKPIQDETVEGSVCERVLNLCFDAPVSIRDPSRSSMFGDGARPGAQRATATGQSKSLEQRSVQDPLRGRDAGPGDCLCCRAAVLLRVELQNADGGRKSSSSAAPAHPTDLLLPDQTGLDDGRMAQILVFCLSVRWVESCKQMSIRRVGRRRDERSVFGSNGRRCQAHFGADVSAGQSTQRFVATAFALRGL